MTQWTVALALVVGVPAIILGIALILPCEGCKKRRERIARAYKRARKISTDTS